MNLLNILKNDTDTPLSLEELETLKRENYIVNDSTPSRIKRSKSYVAWVCKKYPKEVGEYLLKKEDSEINDFNYRAFAFNSELLRKSLIKDYKKTIHILAKHGAFIEDVSAIRDILLKNNFYVNDGSINYLVHINPELINISFRNNFDATVDFLNKNTVLIKPEQRKEMIEILRENNFVVNPMNLEFAKKYHDALRVSLENDEIKTLATRTYETLESIRNDEELYVDYLIRIQKYFLKSTNESENKLVKEMLFAINVENELLFACLDNREYYENFLDKLSECPMFINLDEISSKRLYESLKDINFTIENYSSELLKRNVNFLIASLDNDYVSTTKYLIDVYNTKDLSFINEVINEHLSEEEYQRFKEVLIRNNFMEKNVLYTLVDSNALRVLSEVDVNKAVSVMGIIEEDNPIVIPARIGARILKNLVDKKEEIDLTNYSDDIYFRLMPTITYAPKSRYSKWMKDEEIDYVIEAFNEGIIPMSYLSNDYFLNDYTLSKLNINEDIKPILKKSAYKLYQYNPEDEKVLLSVLNKSSLQDAIMPLKKKKRSELTVEEMLAIKLYGIKTLLNSGLRNYSFDVFNYSEEFSELGSENNAEFYIEMYNGHNRTVYEMIKTIHHEVNHAVQFRNVEEANFEEDEDINDYAKDDILRDIFRTYYEDNYNSISYEYDTEMKAVMLTDAFFDNQSIGKDYLQYVSHNLKYERSSLRLVKDKKYQKSDISLDELFDEVARNQRFDLSEIRKKYKSLGYEYCLDKNPIYRYSVSELVSLAQFSDSEEEKNKYLIVLKRQLDEKKCKRYKENRDELLRLDKEGLIKREIAHEINLYNPILNVKGNFNKYLGYLDYHFDRINKLLTKRQKKQNKKV